MKPKSVVTAGDSAKVLRGYAKAYGIVYEASLRFMHNKSVLVDKINAAFGAEMDQQGDLYDAPAKVFEGKSMTTALPFLRANFKVDTLTQRNKRNKVIYEYYMIRTGKGVVFIRNFADAVRFMEAEGIVLKNFPKTP